MGSIRETARDMLKPHEFRTHFVHFSIAPGPSVLAPVRCEKNRINDDDEAVRCSDSIFAMHPRSDVGVVSVSFSVAGSPRTFIPIRIHA
jgi:hypothetical protein